jgi:hypothetical protein
VSLVLRHSSFGFHVPAWLEFIDALRGPSYVRCRAQSPPMSRWRSKPRRTELFRKSTSLKASASPRPVAGQARRDQAGGVPGGGVEGTQGRRQGRGRKCHSCQSSLLTLFFHTGHHSVSKVRTDPNGAYVQSRAASPRTFSPSRLFKVHSTRPDQQADGRQMS